MIRGIYTAAAGMIANTVGMDVLAHNMANVSTTAFKGSNVNYQSFPEILIQRVSQGESEPLGGLMTGSKVRSTAFDFNQGQLQKTGNPLDMALDGDGFFQVKTPQGELLYTRDGSFSIDENGYLVTQNGYRVQGYLGDILVPPNQEVVVTTKGHISTSKTDLDDMVIAQFKNNHGLEKVEANYYRESEASGILERSERGKDKPFQVRQNMLELSNINMISEMVNSIAGLRLYEALQRNIRMQNDALGKAVNEVGRFNR